MNDGEYRPRKGSSAKAQRSGAVDVGAESAFKSFNTSLQNGEVKAYKERKSDGACRAARQ